jgi:hypothetical protein
MKSTFVISILLQQGLFNPKDVKTVLGSSPEETRLLYSSHLSPIRVPQLKQRTGMIIPIHPPLPVAPISLKRAISLPNRFSSPRALGALIMIMLSRFHGQEKDQVLAFDCFITFMCSENNGPKEKRMRMRYGLLCSVTTIHAKNSNGSETHREEDRG